MFSVADLFAQKKTGSITWYIAGELPPARGQQVSPGVAGAVCGVHNNRMLVAGGANFPDSMPWQGGKKKYYNTIYLFTKKANQLIPVNGDFHLPENIAYAACCTVPGGILYAGGENESGISDKTYLLRWDKKNNVTIDALPALPLPLTNASAASYNNSVFIAGGESTAGVSDRCWSLDLCNRSVGWKELPALPKPVSHAMLVAVNSDDREELYLLGGRRKTIQGTSDLYNSVYEFSPAKNRWRELPPLPYALSAGSVVATGNCRIVLFGGDRGATFAKIETCLAAISNASSESEKEQLIAQKNLLLSEHPGFSRDILFYDIPAGKCDVGGMIPYDTPVTTAAFWWDKYVIIPSGEIRAGVRTPKILMAKLPPCPK